MRKSAKLGVCLVAIGTVFGNLPSAFSTQSDPAIAQGVILNQGVPVSGDTVLAFAWPSQSELDRLPEGATAPLYLVGSSHTSASGAFAIPASPEGLPSTVKNAGGFVNLELVALHDGQEMIYNYSTSYVDQANANVADPRSKAVGPPAWVSNGDAGASEAPAISFDFGRAEAWNQHNDPAGWLDEVGHPVGSSERAQAIHGFVMPAAPAMKALVGKLSSGRLPLTAQGPSMGTDAVASPANYCGLYKTSNTYLNKKEHFTTTETMSGIPEHVSESASATHTMGIAIKDVDGHWGSAGSASLSRTSSVSAQSPNYTTAHTIFNRVNYRDWSDTCTYSTQRRPDGFYDFLTADGQNVAMTWQYTCSPHAAGSYWNSGSAVNNTFKSGVSLGVLSVSAQSGYKSSLNLHFQFNVKGEICGNSTYGPINSSLVQADTF